MPARDDTFSMDRSTAILVVGVASGAFILGMVIAVLVMLVVMC